MSDHMLPSVSVLDGRNEFAGDVITQRRNACGLDVMQQSYGADGIFRQLGARVFAAALGYERLAQSSAARMLRIPRRRYPLKVLDSIILLVSVNVIGLFARFRVSEEGCSNQPVQQTGRMPLLFGNGYLKVTSRRALWFENAIRPRAHARPIAPYSSQIRDAVRGRCCDLQPLFVWERRGRRVFQGSVISESRIVHAAETMSPRGLSAAISAASARVNTHREISFPVSCSRGAPTLAAALYFTPKAALS